eukprot:3686015-Amphidinium_carterae.1
MECVLSNPDIICVINVVGIVFQFTRRDKVRSSNKTQNNAIERLWKLLLLLVNLVFCTRAVNEPDVSDIAGSIGKLSEDDTGRVSALTGVMRREPPG